MELRQLEYAVAVARYRNFTRAAQDRLIAQPALSAQIRKLELELGVRLFDRTTRRVALTPAGMAFVARAERILAETQATAREMAEHAGAVRDKIRIGGWYSVNPDLPAVLAGFVADHPHIDITIREESSDVMLDMLRNGELDLALLVVRDGLDFSGTERVIYRTEPFVLIASKGSPLAKRKEVEIRELGSTPLIVFKPGSAVRHVVEHAFAAAGVPLHVAVETTETSAARAFVSAGLGVALVPRSVAARAGPPVAILPVIPTPVRTSALVWRQADGDDGSDHTARRAIVGYLRRRLGAPGS